MIRCAWYGCQDEAETITKGVGLCDAHREHRDFLEHEQLIQEIRALTYAIRVNLPACGELADRG
jgi:hypothetical protein